MHHIRQGTTSQADHYPAHQPQRNMDLLLQDAPRKSEKY